MLSRLNAPLCAFVVVLAAYVPQVVTVASWPPVGVFLFVAFALTVVGFAQARLLGSALMLLVLFIAGPFQMFIVPFMHAASFGNGQQQAATAAQVSAGENPTSETAANGGNSVALSQQAAVRKHPALAVKDSPLNTAFLVRYAHWQQRGDSRLQQANWPEVLADDCVEHP